MCLKKVTRYIICRSIQESKSRIIFRSILTSKNVLKMHLRQPNHTHFDTKTRVFVANIRAQCWFFLHLSSLDSLEQPVFSFIQTRFLSPLKWLTECIVLFFFKLCESWSTFYWSLAVPISRRIFKNIFAPMCSLKAKKDLSQAHIIRRRWSWTKCFQKCDSVRYVFARLYDVMWTGGTESAKKQKVEKWKWLNSFFSFLFSSHSLFWQDGKTKTTDRRFGERMRLLKNKSLEYYYDRSSE